MVSKLRVPVPTSEREVEIWRILLQDTSGDFLSTGDVLGTADQIVVVDNGHGTITISIDDDYLTTSVLGTIDEIIVTENGDGTVTLSLDESITNIRDTRFSMPFFFGRLY